MAWWLDIKDYQGNPVKAAHDIGADIISPYYTEISNKMLMKLILWV